MKIEEKFGEIGFKIIKNHDNVFNTGFAIHPLSFPFVFLLDNRFNSLQFHWLQFFTLISYVRLHRRLNSPFLFSCYWMLQKVCEVHDLTFLLKTFYFSIMRWWHQFFFICRWKYINYQPYPWWRFFNFTYLFLVSSFKETLEMLTNTSF